MLGAQIIRYLFVGGLAYVIEMSSLYVLHKFSNLSAIGAVAVSFWVGFLTAFLLQKILTFKNHDKRAKAIFTQIILYSLLVGFNYIFSLLMVAILANNINVFIVRTLTIIIVTCWNFYIYRTFIFSSSPTNYNKSAEIGMSKTDLEEHYEKS